MLEWLRHIRASYGAMRLIEKRSAAIRESMDGMKSQSGASVSGGAPSDAMAEALAKLEDLETEWRDAVREYAEEVSEAMEACTATVESQGVWLHYVEGIPWGGVAQILGYSGDHARGKRRRKGISHIYARMPDEWRRNSIPNART